MRGKGTALAYGSRLKYAQTVGSWIEDRLLLADEQGFQFFFAGVILKRFARYANNSTTFIEPCDAQLFRCGTHFDEISDVLNLMGAVGVMLAGKLRNSTESRSDSRLYVLDVNV